MQVGGIVLCGGQSRRMGTSKAMLRFGPEPMLQRVLRVLGQVVQPLAVVAAPGQELPPLDSQILIVRDRQRGRGPLEGLRSGLAALPPVSDAAFVIGCDAPLLQADFIRAMIQELGNHEIAVPIDGQFFHPLAAVYRIRLVRQIDHLLSQAIDKPRLLFQTVPTCQVPVDRLRLADPRLLSLTNVNRTEDYLSALAEAGFEPPAHFSF
jgi:molybdenum cofactor guanylyltransferase